MYNDRRSFLNRTLLVLDAALSYGVYEGCVAVWLGIIRQDSDNIATNIWMGLVFTLIKIISLTLMGLYDSRVHKRLRRQFMIIGESCILETAIVSTFLILSHGGLFSRGVLLSFLAVSAFMTCLLHFLVLRMLLRFGSSHTQIRHILVVGTGKLAREFAANLESHRREVLGEEHVIEGFIGVNPHCKPYLGGIDSLDGLLDTNTMDEVVAALDVEEAGEMIHVIRACERTGTKVSIIPYYNDVMPSNPSIEAVGTSKLINLRSNPLDNLGKAMVKRSFDVVASILLIILLSPVLLILALGTRLSSPGPILFRQERVGKYKKNFVMFKFRSMRVNDRENTAWSTAEDRRKTRFGSFMRKFSLDELPQLFNVVRGDMSLIGPRPEIPFFVERFKDTVPLYMVKHQVRPGMTGWAQVNGYRGDTSIVKRIEYDVWYIENWNIRLDLQILLMTLLGGFMNDEKGNPRRGGGRKKTKP